MSTRYYHPSITLTYAIDVLSVSLTDGKPYVWRRHMDPAEMFRRDMDYVISRYSRALGEEEVLQILLEEAASWQYRLDELRHAQDDADPESIS